MWFHAKLAQKILNCIWPARLTVSLFPVPQIILATKMGVFLYSVRNPSSATKNFCSTAPTIYGVAFAANILTVGNFYEAESTRYTYADVCPII